MRRGVYKNILMSVPAKTHEGDKDECKYKNKKYLLLMMTCISGIWSRRRF